MRAAGLTSSPRLTLPIIRRFILDGLGSFVIHSGTGEPDCNSTFAMLRPRQLRSANRQCNATHDLRYGASASVKYVMAVPV